MGKMSVDVPATTELVVNQTTFYLAFLITLASAGAIGLQVYRGLNNRVKKAKDEQEAKNQEDHAAIKKYVDDKMDEVNHVRERVEYMYRKIVDDFFTLKNNNKDDNWREGI